MGESLGCEVMSDKALYFCRISTKIQCLFTHFLQNLSLDFVVFGKADCYDGGALRGAEPTGIDEKGEIDHAAIKGYQKIIRWSDDSR